MNSQELETAVRLKLNLVVLILNDGAYGMIRWKQAVDTFPDFGLTFGNPDFVRYAEAYGAKGSRVTSVDGLLPTLEAAFSIAPSRDHRIHFAPATPGHGSRSAMPPTR